MQVLLNNITLNVEGMLGTDIKDIFIDCALLSLKLGLMVTTTVNEHYAAFKVKDISELIPAVDKEVDRYRNRRTKG